MGFVSDVIGGVGSAIGGVLGGVGGDVLGSVVSGGAEAGGAYLAAQAQADAAEAATEEERRQFDFTRSDLEPWRDVGEYAIGELEASTGGDLSPFYDSAQYKLFDDYVMGRGLEDLSRHFSAKGTLPFGPDGSLAHGGAYKESLDWLSGGVQNAYNTYANRLSSLAGFGQTAAQASTPPNSISQGMMAGGTASASQYPAYASAIGNVAGTIFGNQQQRYPWDEQTTYGGSSSGSAPDPWGGGLGQYGMF